MKLQRCWLWSATFLLCSMGAGCATRAPMPAPVAQSVAPLKGAPGLTEAEMMQLCTQAEQAIGALDLATAARLYVRVVTAFPNNGTAWFRLGTVYLRTGQAAYAQQSFEQALRIDPSLNKAQANLALAHLSQFRTAAARAITSDQVSDSNRAILRSVLRDIDYALAPAPSLDGLVLP